MLTKAKSLFCTLLALWGVQVSAQNLTKSPYSALGLGESQFGGSASMYAMGQTSQGISMPNAINNQNPASYGAIRQSTWDAAGIITSGKISTATATSNFTNGALGYIALGLPLSAKLKWGMSAGLMPYSSVGYNITRNVQTSTFTGTEKIEGRGGLSKFYIGSGIHVYKGVSFGVNASYLFGQVEHTSLLDIPREYNMYNLVENRSRYLGDFAFDLGLQYRSDTIVKVLKRDNKEHQYIFGAGITISPEANIHALDNYNVRTLGVGNTMPTGLGKDTAANRNDVSGTVLKPLSLKAGLSFQELNKWGVALDVGYTQWSNYQAFGSKDSLKNTLSVGAGAFWIPNNNAIKNYLAHVEYRVGCRYDNGNLSINGNNISTYSVSAGLGLPMNKSKTRLNLSGEYIIRGTTSDKLVKEEYFRFVIGVTISDTWFHRYRYD